MAKIRIYHDKTCLQVRFISKQGNSFIIPTLGIVCDYVDRYINHKTRLSSLPHELDIELVEMPLVWQQSAYHHQSPSFNLNFAKNKLNIILLIMLSLFRGYKAYSFILNIKHLKDQRRF